MCFFYALSREAQSLKQRYQLKLDFDFELRPELTDAPRYYVSGFDYPQMPVITADQPENLQYLQWGLIPSWVKTPEEAWQMRSYTLNARSETVFTKPAFREGIRNRRCLIPAEGFYEWRLFRGRKYPYFIYRKDRELFSFAGIWDEWVDRSTGEVRRTYSILTTAANSLMAQIHNTKQRMPVILTPDTETDWLRRDLSRQAVAALTQPLDAELLTAHTISRLITSRTANRNVPALQEYCAYPELEELG